MTVYIYIYLYVCICFSLSIESIERLFQERWLLYGIVVRSKCTLRHSPRNTTSLQEAGLRLAELGEDRESERYTDRPRFLFSGAFGALLQERWFDTTGAQNKEDFPLLKASVYCSLIVFCH